MTFAQQCALPFVSLLSQSFGVKLVLELRHIRMKF